MTVVRNFITSIVLLAFAFTGYAQNSDSTLYRTHKVKKVVTRLKLPLLAHSNDTCTYIVQKVNEYGLLTSLYQNNNCLGWGTVAETLFEYDSLQRLVGIESLVNDKVQSVIQFELDSFGRILVERLKYFGDEIEERTTTTMYFGVGKMEDSSMATTHFGDQIIVRKTVNFYANQKLVKAEVRDGDTDKMVSMLVMKYLENGKLFRYEYTDFESYDNDEVTEYKYNEEDQLSRSDDILYGTAGDFYYYKNGLLGKVFYYNKFGQMDKEMLHEYEFYE